MKCVICMRNFGELERILQVQIVEHSLKTRIVNTISKRLNYHVSCYENISGEEHIPPDDFAPTFEVDGTFWRIPNK